MNDSNDAIKILARRFVSLSPHVRAQVGEKLLRWREENQALKGIEKQTIACSCAPEKTFIEQFWDEVEAAHGDRLYQSNPFSGKQAQQMLYPMAA